ncbi:hypothetical protein [Luteibacter aegosomatissinici]|uniref:hypothetical protein n=1 Tax=Luteibacter aegosomatissinici TaxID=2911539 RepID=UPI001FFBD52D|nr:hypothetical protein [Luteibacter aegosomatissinici]UPG93008.1 hypothetical protein L2Y97_14150 [Luteibacter aegosomatissinici]
MTLSIRPLIVLAAACIAAPALAYKDDPAAELAKITNGRIAGKPQRCIDLPQVYGTQIIDKTTIAYRIGPTYYVNQLKSGAKALNSDDLMVTKTFGSQLCEMDTVDMVDRYGGGRRGFAVLGPFIPYKLPAKDH